MHLEVDLSRLHAAVRHMGAEGIERTLDLNTPQDALDPIDIQLQEGLEVEISDVDYENGLLSYAGRQVLLYIQDHRNYITQALEDPGQGRKYHVADCKTLRQMREAGRFERYVATNDLSGDFYITGKDWASGQQLEGTVRLKVCKFCLMHLNYQDYRNNRTNVFRRFNLDEFFSTYSSFFPHMPKRRAGVFDGDYSDDWPQIAARYKTSKKFICEECAVDLAEDRALLHAHHIDGVKTNNDRANLRALCADCHRKQVSHEHMYVSHQTTKRIAQLRRAQGRSSAVGWDEAFKLADKGVHGLLALLRQNGRPLPEIGCEVTNAQGAVVAELEIAWPAKKSGIAISKDDVQAGNAAGWRVLSVQEALDRQ